jgi:hypothetical protein
VCESLASGDALFFLSTGCSGELTRAESDSYGYTIKVAEGYTRDSGHPVPGGAPTMRGGIPFAVVFHHFAEGLLVRSPEG